MTHPKSPNLLIIFMKNPIPGKVKTRLGKDLGMEKAAEIYTQLMDYTKSIAAPVQADVEVWYGDQINPNDLWNEEGFIKKQQSGADLGERMKNAFAQGFSSGYSRIIIIGTDCPELDTGLLEQAYTELDEHDVVYGPANDGGYYLMGMKELLLPLFILKSWSEESVLAESINDLDQMEKEYILLPELTDIDTIEDLKKFPKYAP